MLLEPRIHIEFSARSSRAAILRRGPSRWVRLLLWDTESDEVDAGSWFHGRIYEDGCSISPNGALFAYFATKYDGEKTRGVNYAWTAISKPPWLTALALWPQTDTWGGRTAFVENATLIIDCPAWETLRSAEPLPEGFVVLPRWIGKCAPPQTLPEAPVSRGRFDGRVGVDQAGRSFEYSSGKLTRAEKVIVDLASMQPRPEPPPDLARSW